MRAAPLTIILLIFAAGLSQPALPDTLSEVSSADPPAVQDPSSARPDTAVSAGGETKKPGTPPDESSLEVVVFRILNEKARNRFLDLLMPFITDFNRWRFVILPVWLLLVIAGGRKGRWAAFIMMFLIAASDQICTSILKPLVERARPCQVLGGVHFWDGSEGWITTPLQVTKSYKSSFSFPSNHAANITSGMIFLGLVYRKWIFPLALIALAVSYSRVYIGVHWTSDVITGIAIGAILASAAWKAFRYFYDSPGGIKWPWRS